MDQLNHYLRPPTRNFRVLLAAIIGVAVLGAALSFLALRMRGTAVDTERRGDQLSALQAARPVAVERSGAQEVQRKWSQLKAERDFSWPEVFAAVERAGNADIELLAFKPDKGTRTILLGGEARDQKALMTFLAALAEQANLKNVHLTHQQRKKHERLETVVFEIKATIVE